MIGNLKIDQAASFEGMVFLSCEPKREMGSDKQVAAKDGRPKWECQILAAMRDSFGRLSNEVVKVGLTSVSNPGEGIAPFRPVQLNDFEVGVMEKTRKDANGQERIVGVTVWFRASEIVLVGEQKVPGSSFKAA